MKTAFISGGFDCLHAGHLYLLKRAAKLGQLSIGLNHDAYFKKKGVDRPIDTYVTRYTKLMKTGMVEAIYPIEDSPLSLIMKLHPDYIVVGNDYTLDRVVGAVECLTWGGKVVIVTRIGGISTTKIIANLKHEQSH